jgi:uncharacterized protein (TIGR01244 family)
MWPFSASARSGLNFRRIDDEFFVSGQISAGDIETIANAGFKSILCARPDHEEPGQPGFSVIAAAAQRAGLPSAHVPVSGMLGEGQIIRMQQAMQELPRPIFAYCRSGARAGSLYAAHLRAS